MIQSGMFAGTLLAVILASRSPIEMDTNYISNYCTSLSEQQVEAIWNGVKENIEDNYAAVYDFSNYEVKMSEEISENGDCVVSIDVAVDMTLEKKPEESPIIMGMRLASEEYSSIYEKQKAEEIIDKYIEEFSSYYQVPMRTGFLYQAVVSPSVNTKSADIEVELFYKSELDDGEIILAPINFESVIDKAGNEDYSALLREEIGKDAIIRSARTVSYDRFNAVSYAVTHATDQPEFSGNGNSDCANFVSKCVNAGGIPTDTNGNWYPASTWGNISTGGVNWYRTGYYGNGGVIPYLTGKGYFNSVSESGVITGCIMSYNNKSHVAFVTACDGYTIKYSHHSSSAKPYIYYTYNSSTDDVTFYKCSQ